jgi:Holliday junction resolvase RusA-like endonuclease
MNTFTFTVHGRPQQKGSKQRFGKRIVDVNPRAKEWQQRVRSIAGVCWKPEPIEGACAVSLEFYFARPLYHFGSGRNAEQLKDRYAEAAMAIPPDIDKLARTVLDGMTGIVFRDDSRVIRLLVGKSYGDPERVEVEIVRL